MILVQFFVFMFALPYLLFGILLAKIWNSVCVICQPILMLVAAWVALIGLFLIPSMALNERPWLSLVDTIAQSHVSGVPTPFLFLGVAACVFVLSVILRERQVPK